MKEIFEILSKIKTPLGLAGVLAGFLFYIFRQILTQKAQDNKSSQSVSNSQTTIRIVNFIFILCLVSVILGFIGWMADLHPGKHISLILFSRSSQRALDSVIVTPMGIPSNSSYLADANGNVSFDIIGEEDKDSLLFHFTSTKYHIGQYISISLNQFPIKQYLDYNDSFRFNTTKTDNRIEESNTASAFVFNAKSMLYQIPFDSSIDCVIAKEFGDAYRGSVKYSDLPRASECTTKEVKYYIRPLKDSYLRNTIYPFLGPRGLLDKITADSYIVYLFNDLKLRRIDLRLYSADKHFYQELLQAMGQDITGTEFFEAADNKLHFYSSDGTFQKWYIAVLVMTDDQGVNMCNKDWWVIR